MELQSTLDYYNHHAAQFAQSTSSIDFSVIQDRFLAKLEPGAWILDFGCGAGRDTKYFLEKGFRVDAMDGSPELCKIASAYTGIVIRQRIFQELDAQEMYDGIWACASILHLPKGELEPIFRKMDRALKKNGILYASFKYGTFEGMRSGRYFTDFTLESFQESMQDIGALRLEESWVTKDARQDRSEEQWLNLILRKADMR